MLCKSCSIAHARFSLLIRAYFLFAYFHATLGKKKETHDKEKKFCERHLLLLLLLYACVHGNIYQFDFSNKRCTKASDVDKAIRAQIRCLQNGGWKKWKMIFPHSIRGSFLVCSANFRFNTFAKRTSHLSRLWADFQVRSARKQVKPKFQTDVSAKKGHMQQFDLLSK